MAATLAENYYLKALENYPWELSVVLENLMYALGYEDAHPGSNCLMARLKMEYLGNYASAEAHLHTALAAVPEYPDTYELLCRLYIRQEKLKEAQKVMSYAQHVPGIDRSALLQAMAVFLEHKGQLKLAKNYLKVALTEASDADKAEYITEELVRIKRKIKARKKRQFSKP